MIQSMKNLFSRPRRTPRTLLIIASAAVFILATGIIFYESTKKTVALSLDGKKQMVNTHADTINELLEELDVEVGKEDYLSLAKGTEISDDLEVVWTPAVEVELTIDRKTTSVWTLSDTVGEFMKEEGIQLRAEDKVSEGMDKTIEEGMNIKIEKAFPIVLKVGNKEREVWSTSTTVADLLKSEKVSVKELDRVSPELSDRLTGKTAVTVTKVEKVTDVVEEPINYEIISRKDSSLEKGKERVITEGQKGLISKTYELTKENGKIVSKELISEETVEEKIDQVVAVGTKEKRAAVKKVSASSSSSSTDEYYVTATAYTSGCNGCSGKTATGINLRANPNAKVIAVDPSFIPLGTKVYIEGYGYATAADTGGAVSGKKIDVFVPSAADAYNWGVKTVKIKVFR
ncbi:G5 and 3D domain-containing protein [Pradoshia eiseniae]|nr:G5 and 3D domain-containing protein [Pradoshia eiseniae]